MATTTTEERPQTAAKRTTTPRARKPRAATTAPKTDGATGETKTTKAKRAASTRASSARRSVGDAVAAPAKAVSRGAKSASRKVGEAKRSVAKAAKQPTGIALAAGAAGLAAGIAANFVRKAIVQAPTALAGNWDEALKAEHDMTLAIFDKIEQTTEANTTRRATLLTQLKHALAKHALQEENIVYAALRDHQHKAEADKLNHEHGYVKQYLYDLSQIDRASPKWIATVREFRSMIENHMKEEETEIFPRMRAALTDEQNKQLTVAMNKEGLKIA